MASVMKFSADAVSNELRHNARLIEENANKDIVKELSHNNENLLPARECTDFEYYKQRLSQLYCYNRGDIKPLAGWVVTCPQELKTPEEQRAFFEAARDFMLERYGAENAIQAIVHRDEGKREIVQDEHGNERKELVHGQPHLHFCFIPTVRDTKHAQGYKVCAKEVLNRNELKNFHPDLQKYLNEHGVRCNVNSGITAAQGGNRTVDDLKREYDRQREIKVLREQVREVQKERDQLRERTQERVRERTREHD